MIPRALVEVAWLEAGLRRLLAERPYLREADQTALRFSWWSCAWLDGELGGAGLLWVPPAGPMAEA